LLKIDFPSVLRSAAVSATLAGLVLLLSLTPFFDNVLLVLLVVSVLLIPIGAGMYYGRLAPGLESAFQSIVGGALSGLLAGFILGMAFGLNKLMVTTVTTGLLGQAIASSAGVFLITGGILGVAGAILGGIGGLLWKFMQRSPVPSVESFDE
jgi:hypothetical protein